MSVITFLDYTPIARFDATAWTQARIDESAAPAGPWTAIDTIALSPLDSDPAAPATRSFTTTHGTLENGWYRVVFLDAAANEEITPAIHNSNSNLTTLASVRQFRQTGATDAGQDDLITALIPRATAAIQRWCSRQFVPETGVLHKFTYAGGDFLGLYPYDLRAATLVQIDTDTPSPTTLTVGTDYKLRPTSSTDGIYSYLQMATAGGWGYGTHGPIAYDSTPRSQLQREVSITGDWGFATIPPEVEQACIETVKEWAESSNDRNPLSTPDAGAGDMLTSYASGLPYAARVLLSPYRRITVA